MQGTMRVRGLNAAEPESWAIVFQGDDPAQLDRTADEYRQRLGVANVLLQVKLSRGEKAQLTRSVLERDRRKCCKCGSAVNVQVDSFRLGEYHNPDKLVTLCRVCRHARNILLDKPWNEDTVRRWIADGRSAIEELVVRFREQHPDTYTEMQRQLGVEGAADDMERHIIQTMFGANPFRRQPLSPDVFKAFEERAQEDRVPDAFLEEDTDSK